VLGAAFNPVSTYDGRQYVMKPTIYKVWLAATFDKFNILLP